MPRSWPTMVIMSLLLLAIGSQALAGSKSKEAKADGYMAHFRDRAVDLEPFLQGYPFTGIEGELEHGFIRYFETTPEGKWLRVIDALAPHIDLTNGRKIGDIDWSTRSFWRSKYYPATQKLYISSDEANDEHTNIYALDMESGAIEQITENDYTYAWDFSEDGMQLGYVRRTGLQEPMVGCFRVRDMRTGEDREILCDGGGANRFTWSRIAFTPDGKSAILTIQHDGNRRTTSLARIDLENPQLDYLIPPRVERFGIELIEGWVSEHEFLYTSRENGFDNIYHYDLRSRRSTRLTDIREQLRNAFLLDTDPPMVMAMLRRSHESEAQLIDARSGEVLASTPINSWVKIVDVEGASGIFSLTDLTTPFRLEWFTAEIDNGKWRIARRPLASMPNDLKRQIVHVKPERISYPTFDTLPDGSPRMIHAFYMEPIDPPENPDDRLVLITSFYGGGNFYERKTNILGAAGIASFSPATRGSRGFGAEFAALNDGDLGGDEIIDIIYAARWLVENKGYRPHQIGVHGSSHGGYATLRCLTFPPGTNGRGESFDFGFGHSHAGFSDITTFYKSCNIPDWVIQEAGDPIDERDKLLDRSPITHVDKLRAPVLLTHGVNDWRVPVTESRRFVEKARKLGKPVAYVEFPGQGHGIDGLDNNLTYYQALFDFYESLAESKHGETWR